MPDNVLFEDNDGQKIRKILLENNNLHTILRLPDGVFTPYAAGVKTNVLFFEKTDKRTEEVWIYDMRTNVEKITKTKGLTKNYFKEFEGAYQNRTEETERWKKFTYEDIQKRNFNLDITWIKDKSLGNLDNLPEPEVLIQESIKDIKEVLDNLEKLQKEL
jgi:type I restriction enzyme M protein